MGESALKSHMSTVKHSQLAKECTQAINNLSILHFCKPKNSDPSTEKSPLSTRSPGNFSFVCCCLCRNQVVIESYAPLFSTFMPGFECTIPRHVF